MDGKTLGQRLNTPIVANTGLIGGGISIVAAVAYFFKVLSDSNELIWLYEATKTHTDPNGALAKLAGAAIAVVGTTVVSLVAAYLGRPSTIPPKA
jgi:hypothetical protein